MKIGFIGCGNIGKALAQQWVNAGHEVILSSRHPDSLKSFAKKLGPKASVASPEEASQQGEIVLLTIPLGEIPNLSEELVGALDGKIVMDTCNPYPDRDGQSGVEALKDRTGSGAWVANHLPGAIVIKAFNTVYYKLLESEAHRRGDLIGVPLASDNEEALKTVSKLVKDAGFGPVIVGSLRKAKEFDNGTPPYASGASVTELKEILGLKNKGTCLKTSE